MQRRPEQSTQWPYPHPIPWSHLLPTAAPFVATAESRRTVLIHLHPAHSLRLDRPFPPPTQGQLAPRSPASASVNDDSSDDDFWALAASQLRIGEPSNPRSSSADAVMADAGDEDDAIWQLATSQVAPIPDPAPAYLNPGLPSNIDNDSLNNDAWAIVASQDPSSEPESIRRPSPPAASAPEIDMMDDFDDDWWADAADQAALLELAYTLAATQSEALLPPSLLSVDDGAAVDDFDMDDDVSSQTASAYDRKLHHTNTPPSQATQLSSAPITTDPEAAAQPTDTDPQAPTAPSIAPQQVASSSTYTRILIRPKPTIIVPSTSTPAAATTGRTTKRKGKAKRKLWERLPRISPTDLSSAAWCEVQWLFMRTYGRDVKLLQLIGCKVDEQVTKRLAAGTDIHAKLELELHDKVQVKTQTYEDRMALKVLETVFCLNELVTKRITRELRVAGVLTHKASNTSLYLSGIIDQLEIQPILPKLDPGTASSPPAMTTETSTSTADPQTEQSTPRSHIVLSDNKTRRTRSTPTAAQIRTTWIQLATYHRLLTDLFAGTFPPELHLEALDALGDQALSAEVVNYVSGSPSLLGLMHEFAPTLDEGTLTLREILSAQHAIATTLFDSVNVSNTMQVHYLDQKSGEKFATVELELDTPEYNAWLEDFLGMVVGKRDPRGVDDIEDAALKCGKCEYAPACAWREDKDRELQTRAREAIALARATASAASAAVAASNAQTNP